MTLGNELEHRIANGFQHVFRNLRIFRGRVTSHFEKNVVNNITLLDEFPQSDRIKIEIILEGKTDHFVEFSATIVSALKILVEFRLGFCLFLFFISIHNR